MQVYAPQVMLVLRTNHLGGDVKMSREPVIVEQGCDCKFNSASQPGYGNHCC